MKKILMLLMTALLFLSACGAANAPAPAATGAPVFEKTMPEAPAADSYAVSSGGPAGGNKVQADRLVIQNADLSLVVKDPQAKMDEIARLAVQLGGFVVSSNLYKSTTDGVNMPEGSINVRIPAEKLDAALEQIKGGVIEVQSENRTGEDVTQQYVDLQSQLKAKQAAADKLMEIMQKAETTEDTLAVYNQLTQVQSDIEVLKGQINYYEKAAALSAVNVHLVSEASIQPLEVGGWRPQGDVRNALQALIDFFQGFVTFLIYLVILIIPVAALLILLAALLWRLLRWFWRKLFPKKAVVALSDVKISPAEKQE